MVGGTVGGLAALSASIFGVLYWRRRKRVVGMALPKADKLSPAEPYFATAEQYPIIEREVAIARPGGGRDYLTKFERTPHDVPASYGGTDPSTVPEARGANWSRLAQPRAEHGQRGDDRTVRMDASALQRLILSMSGILSDQQQHRRNQSGGEGLSVTNELPPEYEEGPNRR